MPVMPIEASAIERFPFRVSVGCRHTDLDVQKAINNVAIAEMFEEARTQYSVGRKLKPAFDPNRRLLDRLTIRFGEDGRYPGQLDIGVGIQAIGRDGWTVRQLAVQGGRMIALCDAEFSLMLEGERVDLPQGLADLLRRDMLGGE